MDESEYEWDEDKRAANLARHGVDFEEVRRFAWETALEVRDDRQPYGEERWIALGHVGNRLHVLVFAERRGRVRVISLRKANARERRAYEKAQA